MLQVFIANGIILFWTVGTESITDNQRIIAVTILALNQVYLGFYQYSRKNEKL